MLVERDWLGSSKTRGCGYHRRSCLGHAAEVDRVSSFVPFVRGTSRTDNSFV
jgi:hypothetical protein